jgi:hypothetical protein
MKQALTEEAAGQFFETRRQSRRIGDDRLQPVAVRQTLEPGFREIKNPLEVRRHHENAVDVALLQSGDDAFRIVAFMDDAGAAMVHRGQGKG